MLANRPNDPHGVERTVLRELKAIPGLTFTAPHVNRVGGHVCVSGMVMITQPLDLTAALAEAGRRCNVDHIENRLTVINRCGTAENARFDRHDTVES